MTRQYLKRLVRVFRRARTDESGTTMIEFGMLAPVIFLVTIGLFEASMMVSVKALLDAGTREAARFGVTGEVIGGETREQTIHDIIASHTSALVIGSAINVTMKSYETYHQLTSDPDSGVTGAGVASNVVVYTVTYQQPLLTPYLETILGLDHVPQNARVIVQNEPFRNLSTTLRHRRFLFTDSFLLLWKWRVG